MSFFLTLLDWVSHPVIYYKNIKQIELSNEQSSKHHKQCIQKLQAIESRYNIHYSDNKASCTLKK